MRVLILYQYIHEEILPDANASVQTLCQEPFQSLQMFMLD
jgi:hypothetical protein